MLFPAIGSLGERKTHTVGGSVNSWIVSGDVATAHTILDVEGITDLLAVVSAGLPPGWVAVTNTGGVERTEVFRGPGQRASWLLWQGMPTRPA